MKLVLASECPVGSVVRGAACNLTPFEGTVESHSSRYTLVIDGVDTPAGFIEEVVSMPEQPAAPEAGGVFD